MIGDKMLFDRDEFIEYCNQEYGEFQIDRVERIDLIDALGSYLGHKLGTEMAESVNKTLIRLAVNK